MERHESVSPLASHARARLAASELGSSNLSKEQEEVIRQLHLLERMGPYTALIQRDDIRNSGQKLDSSHYEQSDSHGGNDIEADNDTSDNEVDTMQVDFALSKQCSETIVRVPHAGEVMGSAETRRDIPNGCAICLSEFEAGHRVTWASNGDCPHCFHEQCILNWMLAVGKKKQLERNPNDTMDQSVDPIQLAITFPKLCPCCRRPFFAPVMTTNHDFCDQSSMIPLASPTSTTANISMDLSDDISMVPRPDLVSPVNLNQNSDDNPSFSSAREPQQNDYI